MVGFFFFCKKKDHPGSQIPPCPLTHIPPSQHTSRSDWRGWGGGGANRWEEQERGGKNTYRDCLHPYRLMEAPSRLAGGVRGWNLGETDRRRFPRWRRGAGAGEQLTHTPVKEEKESASTWVTRWGEWAWTWYRARSWFTEGTFHISPPAMLLGSILSCSVCAHIRYTAATSRATPPTTPPHARTHAHANYQWRFTPDIYLFFS